METSSEAPRLLNPKQTAEALGIKERKLWSLSAPRGEIPVVRYCRKVFYDTKDLREYIDKYKKRAPSDVSPQEGT